MVWNCCYNEVLHKLKNTSHDYFEQFPMNFVIWIKNADWRNVELNDLIMKETDQSSGGKKGLPLLCSFVFHKSVMREQESVYYFHVASLFEHNEAGR